MQSMWTRFEQWLAEHWPEGLRSLNPPATDEQIADLENALGVALPDDYKACLKIHNGHDANLAFGLFYGSEYLSTDELLSQWNVWKELLDAGDFEFGSEPASGIKNDWWNSRWIPFTHNGGGDHLCIDLDPAAGGRHGQIITMWHDSAERELVGPDFYSWFKVYTKDVFSGKYVYSKEHGGLIDRQDAMYS